MFILSLIVNHLFLYNLIGVVVLIGVLIIEIHRDVSICYGVTNPRLLLLIPIWPLLILEQLFILGIIIANKIYKKNYKKSNNSTISCSDADSMYPSIILESKVNNELANTKRL